MERPSVFSFIALACLALAAGLNLFLYPLSFYFRLAFFAIPVALGAYGILTRSRAFTLSAGASLVLVSLRPDDAEPLLVLPFALLFIFYLESAEASVRFAGAGWAQMKSYLLGGGAVAAGGVVVATAVFYSSPFLARLFGEAGAQAAVFDSIYLPLAAGGVAFALIYLLGTAIRG